MRSSEIRRTFLDFFAGHDHRVWPSSSLIPNDPTMLLTIAGMVQFKPYFAGDVTPDHPRAASAQKVARTVDIDNVGVTTRHLTFFEMLGNFSFGDYFKTEAIAMAWSLSTRAPPDGFGFDPERIWVTIYEDDDDAEAIWRTEAGLPAERIVRRGADDNFWSTGGAGPCGPCTELFYDRGPAHGPDGGPAVDESRFMEFWNLVFMEFSQDADGQLLGKLPQPNVDTGMGLERMAVLLQDVANVYETDVLRPMLDRAVELTGVSYGDAAATDVSLRVVAEHARTAAFLIADGVLPANEGRGYVLRRLLRRVVRHTRSLGFDDAVMPGMMATVVATLGEAWPDLATREELITRVAAAEEQGFARTLASGMSMLTEALEAATAADGSGSGSQAGAATSPASGGGPATAESTPVLPAETAFTLHDTYGFPVDLTTEIAAEHGVALDHDAFAELMEAQRARARAAAKGSGDGVPGEVYRAAQDRAGASRFRGYEEEACETELGALVTPGGLVETASEGDELEVVLPATPFYPEGGGQLGDHGLIVSETDRLRVVDTFAPVEGVVAHKARVEAGEAHSGQGAHAEIDHDRRASIRRGHTATHILHATLQDVIGDHAAQAGSAIDAGRFRFDFPHFEALSTDQVTELEERINARVNADPEVAAFETSQSEAKRMGAVALFGETYGERVRVVSVGDFSLELCGGTHVGRGTEVGLFTVLSEGSIASNLRRIEALTGPEAFTHLSRERLVAEQVAELVNAPTDQAVERVSGLLERVKAAEKEAAAARQRALLASAGPLAESAERISIGVADGDAGLVAARLDDADRDGLKTVAADLCNRLGSGVVVLGSPTADGKAALVAAVSADLLDRGVVAGEVLRPGAEVVGGGAGGKGGLAQAGGPHGGSIDAALETGRETARRALLALDSG
jgi:alanyl-tRNA synthetase